MIPFLLILICFSLIVYLSYQLLKSHKHEYVKTGFRQAEDRYTRYSIRKYECIHCGKTKEVDGRFDKN